MNDAHSSTISELAAKGGEARAKSLTKEQRSEIARRAVEARWAKQGKSPVPRATHTGNLTIGDISIPCCVLNDGTRLVTQRGFLEAMGKHPKANVRPGGEERVPPILQGKSINPFIDNDLLEKSRPVVFITPNGQRASGYRADLLPRVCEVFLQARDAGKLNSQLEHVAKRAEILIRGLAHVGIIALVDEATGFQADRSRDALAKILEAFIAKELRPWARAFQPDFYEELFRLRAIPFNGSLKQPRYIGHLINDIVYKRLAPGVLEELRRLNPTNGKGQRRVKHFQWLTEHVGYQKLSQHLAAATALMRVVPDGNYDGFKKLLDKALPVQVACPLFDPIDVPTKELPVFEEPEPD